jgi:hypothetical protein
MAGLKVACAELEEVVGGPKRAARAATEAPPEPEPLQQP